MRTKSTPIKLLALSLGLLGYLPIAYTTADWKVVSATDGEEVRIFRDEFGVPHVFAETLGGVSFGHGYAIATDRLNQMFNFRAGAREIAGYQGDSIATWADQFELLSATAQYVFNAYAAGVNARIEDVEADPAELLPLQLAGKIPLTRWDPLDSFAVFATLADQFGQSACKELNNLLIYNALGPTAFNDAYPINNPSAPTTIRSGTPTIPPPKKKGNTLVTSLVSSVGTDSLLRAKADFEEHHHRIEEVFASHGMPTSLGSFAVTVSPGQSVDGRPLLLGCPQMGGGLPQISCQVGLYGGNWEVTGMVFAGVPMVLIGRNRHLAWTTTSGFSDNTDIFIEELNPADTTQYLHNGAWVTAEYDPLTDEYFTIHGRVFSTNLGATPPTAYVERVTYWGEEWRYVEGFLGMAKATNVWDYREAASLIPGSHNFLYSGTDGHNLYIHSGMYPLRAPTVDARLPASGTGEQDWQGFIPVEDLPQQIDPPEGFFTNWNNKPVIWWDQGDGVPWRDDTHRVQDIFAVLDPLASISYADVRGVPQSINSRGTYQQIVVSGSVPIPAENIGSGGQSGFISPSGLPGPHFRDQDPIYQAWDYKPFYFFLDEADQEEDRMPNGWEVRHLLDPLSDDSDEDPDGDGFSNLLECQEETDPRDADSHPGPSSVANWRTYR